VESASELAYRLCCVEQCPCGVGAEGDDDVGVNDFDLSLEVGQAAYYFIGFWVTVVGWSAFQNVAYPDVAALEAAGGDDFVEELSCPADKGSALCVFVCTRAFSDEHNSGVRGAFAGHGVGTQRAETAVAAGAGLIGYFFEELCGLAGVGSLPLWTIGLGRFLDFWCETAGEELLHFDVLMEGLVCVGLLCHWQAF